MGLSYGDSFRSLSGVWSIPEPDGRMLAVGELRLPQQVASIPDQYVLHPSILDGALQASIPLKTEKDQVRPEQFGSQLPFALDRLEIFRSAARAGLGAGAWWRGCRWIAQGGH